MGIDEVSVIAARILRDIVDGRALRREVDISNMDEVIVAAYDLGRSDLLKEQIKEVD